jgi:hypothetical protein
MTRRPKRLLLTTETLAKITGGSVDDSGGGGPGSLGSRPPTIPTDCITYCETLINCPSHLATMCRCPPPSSGTSIFNPG